LKERRKNGKRGRKAEEGMVLLKKHEERKIEGRNNLVRG
jgi:hypothetical protein